jgi:hypothetical protein
MIADSIQAGNVFVIRNRNILGSAVSYYITLDGTDMFAIRVGQHTKFSIAAGEHYLGVKCFGGWAPTWKEDSKKFNLLPQGDAYFLVSPSLSCADIQAISPESGKEWIDKSTYIRMSE